MMTLETHSEEEIHIHVCLSSLSTQTLDAHNRERLNDVQPSGEMLSNILKNPSVISKTWGLRNE